MRSANGGSPMAHFYPYKPVFLLLLALAMIFSACGGPRHGVIKQKKRRGCDCPKWNSLPAAPADERRVDIYPQRSDLAALPHATPH